MGCLLVYHVASTGVTTLTDGRRKLRGGFNELRFRQRPSIVFGKGDHSMTRDKSLALGFGIALAVMIGSASIAHAQYAPGYGPPPGYYPPAPRMYRSGLVLGVGVGFGLISAADCGDICGGVLSGEFHIGGMMNPRLAVMADFWGNVRNSSDLSTTVWNGIYTGALQYWATDILWLKGGAGLAHMQLTDNGSGFAFGDEWGFGLMGAAGLEVVQSSTFALDLQLRLGHGFFSQGGDVNNVALMVGFNWY
jgi:hypothetical protein